MAILNKQASGLLDFLGIKDGGWGPRDFASTLQPHLDLWRHYVAANATDWDGVTPQIVAGGTGQALANIAWTYPISASGGLTPQRVPQDEIWYIDTASIHLLLSTGVGSIVTYATVVESDLSPGAYLAMPFAPLSPVSSSAGGSTGAFTSLQYPVFLRPGALMQAFLGYVVAATETLDVRITMRGARLKI